ncbi:Zinc finger C2H2 protein [Astathelohania contejeani]|uniref:Zinc finger C2H2 protein n=1 Tax=Astathelohania contejeani TaxID=164912 RepID=A0ABQ7HYB4_9MICR|nr:Zinc finger C2H2 protein [Thelohania contejeani]
MEQPIVETDTRFGSTFPERIKRLLNGIKDISRLNEIPVSSFSTNKNFRNIFLFQVNGEFYFPIVDAHSFLEIYFQDFGYKLKSGWKDKAISLYRKSKMSEILELYSGRDIDVVSIKEFNATLVKNIKEMLESNNLIESDSSKIREGLDSNNTNLTIDFNAIGDCRDTKTTIEDENTGILDHFRCTELYPFPGDWTTDMVDTIIGKMFTEDEWNQRKEKMRDEALKVQEEFVPPVNESDYMELSKHNMGNKNESKNRPFICHYKYCNRAFKRFEHLKRHYRIHTGERPFKCPHQGCLKAFSRSDNLNQHLKVHGVSLNYDTRSNVNNKSRYFE